MAIDPMLAPSRIRRIVKHATVQISPRAGLLLLLSLLLLLVAAPFVQPYAIGMVIEKLLFTTMLVAAVATSSGRRTLILAVLLASPVLVFNWFHHAQPARWSRIVACAFGAGFIAWVVWRLVRSLLTSGRVGSDVLCTALSAYLMLGVIWALLYSIVNDAVPGSFALPPETMPAGLVRFELVYFSFITLCTVGYGDIVPASNAARMLAMLEAIIGMIFTTILLARLVSLYAAHPARDRAADR